MTSSPAANPVTPSPVRATTPARSLPCPDGNVAGHRSCSRPARTLASPGLIPAALTWTRTWPGPGSGVGTSTTFKTSTSPYSSNRTAFMPASIRLGTPQPRDNPGPRPGMPARAGQLTPPGIRMSVPSARVPDVADRWDRARVLALAPDAPSERAAQALAARALAGRPWPAAGAGPGALWGECPGSASAPYRTVVDLSGPAYRCSCPSRKFPCKHALALLLLWAAGTVPQDAGEPPGWAAGWLAGRAASRARSADGGPGPGRQAAPPGGPKDPRTAARRAEQREARVASGLAELDRWLCDQVSQGLAASQQAGYRHWDDIAARMVDAQAPGVAERLRGLAAVPHSGPGWDGRLLEEYALLRLLALAYRRQAELPPPLRETVRSRIGFSRRQADVLASGPPVRDHWQVLARRDLEQDRIRVRRTWL